MLFSDQLEYEIPRVDGMATQRHEDANGDTIERRVLSDGRKYEIVKNFPTEQELIAAVNGFGTDLQYREWPGGETLGIDVQVCSNIAILN